MNDEGLLALIKDRIINLDFLDEHEGSTPGPSTQPDLEKSIRKDDVEIS